MTNADKYLKDGVDVEEFIGEFNDFISRQTENQSACVRLAQFLKYPAKPTLTEDERVILRNIKDFENDAQNIIIGNNQSFSGLYIEFIYEYANDNGVTGISSHKEPFRVYNHLFQFIKPRRRI